MNTAQRSAIIPLFWGLCDLGSLAWYIGWRIYQGQFPFYYDYLQAYMIMRGTGDPMPVLGCAVSILLYLSLAFSGVLLLRKKILGAILSYIQTPFRLLILIPPSLFFIHWPWKYIINKPTFAFGVFLLIASEIFKVATVVIWHKRQKRLFAG
ncbi:MAG: hypothetical protein ABFD81_13555 [Syntrophaceae bacterium]